MEARPGQAAGDRGKGKGGGMIQDILGTLFVVVVLLLANWVLMDVLETGALELEWPL